MFVEPPSHPEIANESAPLSSIIRWHFPARGNEPELFLGWWDGGMKPQRPEELERDRQFAEEDWLMIVGDKGKMLRHRLIPDAKAREFGKPPRILERAPGHYVEWIEACKGGNSAGSNFVDHAAHLCRGSDPGQHRYPHRREALLGSRQREVHRL